MNFSVHWVATLSLMASLGLGSKAAQARQLDLADLSLEELSNLQITSVSKRAEPLSDAPASVFVITAEDLRRSGVLTLPDALRLAPNLHVGQRSASQYSIGARGLNNTAGNKMLVLIDGRSVYTPLFSGVFWDAQDVMLEDVERIEIISGPGGLLWGVNAVNGVINIITRSAKATQGTLATATAGNRESGGGARYGGALGGNGHFRVYGKYFDRQETRREDGAPFGDAWNKVQGGFRADWSRDQGDELTFQGDAYDASEGQAAPGTITLGGVARPLNMISISGANLLGRLTHRLARGAGLKFQAYYDHTLRDVPGTFRDELHVLDLQFEHSLQPMAGHALIWGGEYRHGVDNVTNSDFVAFLPARSKQVWSSLFAQDKITLGENLQLTLGARIETNHYTKPDLLPSARLAWKVAENHSLWMAASRVARAPSRIDRDFYYPTSAPFVIDGGPNFKSEVANVYELGYRGQPTANTSWSVTAFHTVYDRLRTLELVSINTVTGLPLYQWSNKIDGHTTGLETWGTYQATSSWRLSAGLTTLHKNLQLKASSLAQNGGTAAEGNDPDFSWNLRSTLNFFERWELDATVRRVSALPLPAVPAYTAIDLRLGWRPGTNLEFSLGGRNLFMPAHVEFFSAPTRSALASAVYVQVVSRF